jgi:hypothetical protein
MDKESHSEGKEAALQKKQQREEKARERKEQREREVEEQEERKLLSILNAVLKHRTPWRSPQYLSP